MPPVKTKRVQGRTSSGRRTALARLAAATLVTASLALSGCPVTRAVRNGGEPAETHEQSEPGPPEILNPSLLDRG